MNEAEGESKEGRAVEACDDSLIALFASRGRRGGTGGPAEVPACGGPLPAGADDEPGALIEEADLQEFTSTALRALDGRRNKETLCRALACMIPAGDESSESYFLKLFTALESALTFFRPEDEYDILPQLEFSELERDLKKWLKQHPLLAPEPQKRALIYEKIRELNRFPFSHVFKTFCQRHEVYLEDLWPLTGRLDGWPLLEIRHRLVHGDPFQSRPTEAFDCALKHLRWTTERMLLRGLDWPVERSNVSPERLAGTDGAYMNWPAERARLA
jgi:hypothetical protein